MSGFPIQYAKVQPPPLPEATLARHRLLEWLAVKVHHRVVLVLADAGYGKTTILADFSARTRLRTIWYRLDDDDRDWISLLSHLVAACREADPAFGARTAAMLADTSLSGPTRDAVIEAFLRELQGIASQGAVLIFDDFHLVDESPDAQHIAREMIQRGPERLSIIFSSRRRPGVPLAKLRAVGEVAELTTDDLRFDVGETERLFREAYHRALEPDVLADLTARTEGWAASLQLVHAAMRNRTPGEIRGFVRGLTGGDHELYDYLAEEVVGDLPEDVQAFLMRTSILQVVSPDLAEVVTDLDAASVARLQSIAERLTLLGRRGRGARAELRYHPLVREFLETRLRREFGHGYASALHRRVATFSEGLDWRVAAFHHWAAGDRANALRTIELATKKIIGRGEYLVAVPFLADLDPNGSKPGLEVVLSRRDFEMGKISDALARARRAVDMDPTSDVALANLASQLINSGEFSKGTDVARRLLAQGTDPGLAAIADGMVAIVQCSVDGNLAEALEMFRSLARQHIENGDFHFAGISHLNIADAARAAGDISASRESAIKSIELLREGSSETELPIARALRAWGLAHEGDLASARDEMARALTDMNDAGRADVLYEAADAEASYGSLRRADDCLRELRGLRSSSVGGILGPLEIIVLLRKGRTQEAARLGRVLDPNRPSSMLGNKARTMTVRAHALIAVGDSDSAHALDQASDQASKQGAGLWADYCAGMRAVLAGPEALGSYVRQRAPHGCWSLSHIAELVVERLDQLDADAQTTLLREATLRPERWQTALRIAIDSTNPNLSVGRLLEAVGDSEDIPRLRRMSRGYRGLPENTLGKALARRIANRVFVEDQGRVLIHIGDRSVEGSSVRRKVLALLCFLVSRPGFSATRDEVMDALWPDVDPSDALNSLNQTIYFLRRVFEPAYKEDLSPGYVHHDSDVVWLDRDLVRSRSSLCSELVTAIGSEPSPGEVDELSRAYKGLFALDFMYEEWASDFRTALHASFLQVVEKAVATDTSTGHFERGIRLARRALDLSPDADQIELSLLRLYQLNGSHAAAAEQYAHYAATMREALGVDPPPLESLWG